MSAWPASLRIARRDAWRHKGRSALVVVMIGLPVAAITFGDVAFRTLQLSPEQEVTARIGPTADAWVSVPTGHRLWQSPPGSEAGVWTGRPLPGPPPSVGELLPGATRVLETRLRYGGSGVTVRTADRSALPGVRELDYTDPLAVGLVEQVSGRAPVTTDEVVVTEPLADSLRVGVGDTVTVEATDYTVVGVVRLPFGRDWSQVIGLPGAFPQVAFRSDPSNGGLTIGSGWLVSQPGGLDYGEWQRLNAAGSVVVSRAVAANPPASCSTEVPSQVRMCSAGPMSPYERQQLAQTAALVALLVGMGLLQVVLLVGPAFAIGRRRQAHDLALVAAVGGDARAVRRIVLASGLVLGLSGGLAGLVTGVVGFWLARPAISRIGGTTLFSTDLRPELALVVGAAMLTGLVAAWLPARQAARQEVVAALAGRRGVTQGPRWVPVAGLVALGAGVAIALLAALPGQPALLLLGCVTAELGLVTLAPTLVAGVSRVAPRLPTEPRLALRDAGRNRMRAGTAVAAVLAAVAGATALGIYVASDAANNVRHYQTGAPIGYVAISTDRGTWPTPSPDLSEVSAALPTDSVVLMQGARHGCMFGSCAPWRAVSDPSASCVGPDGAPVTCSSSFSSRWAAWLVGDDDTYRALTGVAAGQEAAAALAAGGVVVTGDSTRFLHGGRLELRNRRTDEVVSFPAAVADDSRDRYSAPRFEILFSETAFERLGLDRQGYGVTIVTTRSPTSAELAVARQDATELVPHARVDLAQHQDPGTNLPLRLLLAAAAVIAVAATATAVGLAGADGRSDLATLAAVGASPRTRRWLSASHAALIAGLGTLLGVAGGLVVGVAAVNATPDHYFGTTTGTPTIPLAVPWSSLATLAVVVPVVAVVLAWLFSRSRLPMVQRLD